MIKNATSGMSPDLPALDTFLVKKYSISNISSAIPPLREPPNEQYNRDFTVQFDFDSWAYPNVTQYHEMDNLTVSSFALNPKGSNANIIRI